jgi:flagellar biosynthesis protein FliR
MNFQSLVSPADLGLVALRYLVDPLLVFCRILGLLVLIPGINAASLGWHLRAILLITLAAIIAPNVSADVQDLLNPSVIQQASREEPAFEDAAPAESTSDELPATVKSPTRRRSVAGWIHAGLAELCLGLLLGVGANVVIQSFRMLGTLIEQQLGLSLAAGSQSELTDLESGSGELMFWLGSVLFLIAGGHLLFIGTLLDTFREFPVGYGSDHSELNMIAAGLVHQSLKLALQLAAPIIATQILVSCSLSYAGNLAPQFNTTGVSSPIRIVTACVVLSLTLTGLADRIFDAIPAILLTARQSL